MKEEMEGKDLAQEEKLKAFIEELKELIKQSQELENSTISSNNYEVSFNKETKTYEVRFEGTGILLAQESKSGFDVYPEAIDKYNKLVEQAQKDGIATLDNPAGLVESEELEEFLEKQKELEEERGEKEEAKSGEEREEEEKDDEKPELNKESEEAKDEMAEAIANKYNIPKSNVIHISNKKNVTKNASFKETVEWARDYDDIFLVQGKEDQYTWDIIGNKDGKYEEIEDQNKNNWGKRPDINIKRIDGDKIEEIQPLTVKPIDNKSVLAIVKNQAGKPEALYCRQEGGNKKEFWGIVVPEETGKNVLQEDYETRDFMSDKSNSSYDLEDKAKALSRQTDLEERGLPSDKKGTQVSEINGTDKQNRELNIKEVEDELMKRDGIEDRLSAFPGYYEAKARKVLDIMEKDDKISFEEAVEEVEQEEKGPRTNDNGDEQDGRAPRR